MLDHDVSNGGIFLSLDPEFILRYLPDALLVLYLTAGHIHLGDDTVKSDSLELLYCLVNLGGVESGDRCVHLHTYTVNGNSGILKSLGQVIHGMGLTVLIMTATPVTDIVVVDVKLGIGVSLMSPHESRVNIVLTSKTGVPYGIVTGSIAVTYGASLVLLQALVHHIPFGNLSLPVSHHIIYMVLEDIDCLLPAGIAR